MKPLPSVIQVYALMIQDEKQREFHSSTFQFMSDSASMNVKSSRGHFRNNQEINQFKGNYEAKKNITCNFCKKPAHSANKCYRLIGFPKDFKFTKGTRIVAANASSFQSTNGEGTTQQANHVHSTNIQSLPQLSNEQIQQYH